VFNRKGEAGKRAIKRCEFEKILTPPTYPEETPLKREENAQGLSHSFRPGTLWQHDGRNLRKKKEGEATALHGHLEKNPAEGQKETRRPGTGKGLDGRRDVGRGGETGAGGGKNNAGWFEKRVTD